MLGSKLGINLLAGGDYDEPQYGEVVKKLNSPVHLIMDNPGLVSRMRLQFPSTKFILRSWPDDNRQSWQSPSSTYNQLRQLANLDTHTLLYTQNEPEHTEASAKWEIAMIELADLHKQGLVVLNSGMGGPEDWEWEGPLRPLLWKIAESNAWRKKENAPLVYLGLHEYFDYHNWHYSGIKYEYRHVPENERTDAMFVNYDPLTGNNWLIGRFTRMLRVCDLYGIPYPPIIITEHGSDSLIDIYHGYKAGAGIPSREYARQLVEMQQQIYNHPAIHGVLIFAWE